MYKSLFNVAIDDSGVIYVAIATPEGIEVFNKDTYVGEAISYTNWFEVKNKSEFYKLFREQLEK